MELLLDALSWVCIVAGSIGVVAGGIGVLRLSDVFARAHAAGVTDTLGAGLLLIGLMFQTGSWLIIVKLILILGFLFFTSPASSHALARSALAGGIKPKLDGGDH